MHSKVIGDRMRLPLTAVVVLMAMQLGCLQVVSDQAQVTSVCCTVECIHTLLGCGLQLQGATDRACFQSVYSSMDQDAGAAIAQYAADACAAGNEGAEVGCIANSFPGNTCAEIERDAGSVGLQAAIEIACPAGFTPGQCDSACVICENQCLQATPDCDAKCFDAGGFYGCLGCDAACNQSQFACEKGCTAK